MDLPKDCPICKKTGLEEVDYKMGRFYRCPKCSVTIWVPLDILKKIESAVDK